MKEKTVIIEIDEHGNSSVDLEGFHGKGCADVAKEFQGQDALKSLHKKPEFYLQQPTARRQQQQS